MRVWNVRQWTALKRKFDDRNRETIELRENLNQLKIKFEKAVNSKTKLIANLSKTSDENRKLRKQLLQIKQQQKFKQSNMNEIIEDIKPNINNSIVDQLEKSKSEIIELRKIIEIEKAKEIGKLKIKIDSLSMKCDLMRDKLNFENTAKYDKQFAKLLDAIENEKNVNLDLECTIAELKFDREHVQLLFEKSEKKLKNMSLKMQYESQSMSTAELLNMNSSEIEINIKSRNDPQLQNLLDSMKFLMNKLKKENESLLRNRNKISPRKMKEKVGPSLIRIQNLLKENRNLKKKMTELNMNAMEVKENSANSNVIQSQKLEIHRMSNLNRRLNKELKKSNENSDRMKMKNEKLNVQMRGLNLQISDMSSDAKAKVRSTEAVWMRKCAILKEDVQRFESNSCNLKLQLKHKQEINHKMSEEMKALLELIEHQQKMKKKELELQSKSKSKQNQMQSIQNIQFLEKTIEELKEENNALRSELSAFDISFFNEIEDLKYREYEGSKTITELRLQLKEMRELKKLQDMELNSIDSRTNLNIENI